MTDRQTTNITNNNGLKTSDVTTTGARSKHKSPKSSSSASAKQPKLGNNTLPKQPKPLPRSVFTSNPNLSEDNRTKSVEEKTSATVQARRRFFQSLSTNENNEQNRFENYRSPNSRSTNSVGPKNTSSSTRNYFPKNPPSYSPPPIPSFASSTQTTECPPISTNNSQSISSTNPPPLPTNPPPSLSTSGMPRRRSRATNPQPPCSSSSQEDSPDFIRSRPSDHREHLQSMATLDGPHSSSAVRLPYAPIVNDVRRHRIRGESSPRSLSTVFLSHRDEVALMSRVGKENIQTGNQVHNARDFELASNKGLLHVQKGRKLLDEGQYSQVSFLNHFLNSKF